MMEPNVNVDGTLMSENIITNDINNDFFGGNPDVFDNLDKFEQFTNPLSSDYQENINRDGEELIDFEIDGENVLEEPSGDFIEEITTSLDNLDTQESSNLDTSFLEIVKEENEDNILYEEPNEMSNSLENVEEQVSDLHFKDSIEELDGIKEELMPENATFSENGKFENLEEDPSRTSIDINEVYVKTEEIEKGMPTMQNIDDSERIEIEDEFEEEIIEELDPEKEANQDMETYNPKQGLENKFITLLNLGRSILNLEQELYVDQKRDQDIFEVLGEDSKNTRIIYTINITEQDVNKVSIERTYLDRRTEEEEKHTLAFSHNRDSNIDVMVDNYLLYQQTELHSNERAEHEVITKIDKFIFLFEQKQKELNHIVQKQIVEKEQQKAFRTIFRNF